MVKIGSFFHILSKVSLLDIPRVSTMDSYICKFLVLLQLKTIAGINISAAILKRISVNVN